MIDEKKQANQAKFKALLGKRIVAAREKLDISRSGLAKKMNTSAVQLSHYESGRRAPGSIILYKLCKALDISADELLGL